MSPHVGLLHTVPALARDLEELVRAAAPDARVTHLAESDLLTRAIRDGVDEALTGRVVDLCRTLVDSGCEAVLVTCSSIGEAAQAADARLGAPVVRIDAAMAAEAARRATAPGAVGRVAVVATLASTLGPSARLVGRELGAGSGVEIEAVLCEGAADARAAGDLAEHDRIVGARLAEVGRVDAVVLAQASMAGAASAVDLGDVPVLTSPASGVAAFVEGLRARG
ncbi:aspartate/glutamate racemase family protein [Oerskovia turbata]